MAISDVITVMRNGAVVAEVDPRVTTIPELISAMIGDRQGRTPDVVDVGEPAQATSALQVTSVEVAGRLADTSFVASPGEVLGLAGLEESGVGAVFDLLFGLATLHAGNVVLPDGGGAPASPARAVLRGVARVPADRRTSGLMLDRSVVDNLTAVTVCALNSTPFLVRRGRLVKRVNARKAEMSIRMGSPLDQVTQLSGGNQQKVLLAKWLEAEPTLFVLDDPTRGVDVGAKAEIYQLIRAIADKGRVVLFSSTDLREYELLCSRVLVFYRGTCAGELTGAEVNEHRLLEAVNTGRVSLSAV
jgi:ABC-type sugar transport system ATPase subunit